MDTKGLKAYIYENNYAENILSSIGCHHIKYHASGSYWTAANPDGDNTSAIVLYNNESLHCIDYTRQIVKINKSTDIIDLVGFFTDKDFIGAVNHICKELNLSYYHNFQSDLPDSFQVLDLIKNMSSQSELENEPPLKPIDTQILQYYKPYVNDMFYQDHIEYSVQREFGIGYDESTNRITIPIFSECGDLIGIKGRLFSKEVPADVPKYLYIEPCPKGKILYGLHLALPYIKRRKKVFVVESEKAVMQCFSYGFENVVATGGSTVTSIQIDMLTRLGVDIVIAYDKDIGQTEIERIGNMFPEGVPIWAIYDTDNILEEKESPSDNPQKWSELVSKHIYKIR